jgi:DNA-binding IclR family transcriptional regulator
MKTTSCEKRPLLIIQLLSKANIEGMSTKQICSAIGDSESSVLSSLNTLIDMKFVERLFNGRYVLSQSMAVIAWEHFRTLYDFYGKFEVIDGRISRKYHE